MGFKILFILLIVVLAMILAVAIGSPPRRRVLHQFVVLLAKVILCAAVCGAVLAYLWRYGVA